MCGRFTGNRSTTRSTWKSSRPSCRSSSTMRRSFARNFRSTSASRSSLTCSRTRPSRRWTWSVVSLMAVFLFFLLVSELKLIFDFPISGTSFGLDIKNAVLTDDVFHALEKWVFSVNLLLLSWLCWLLHSKWIRSAEKKHLFSLRGKVLRILTQFQVKDTENKFEGKKKREMEEKFVVELSARHKSGKFGVKSRKVVLCCD